MKTGVDMSNICSDRQDDSHKPETMDTDVRHLLNIQLYRFIKNSVSVCLVFTGIMWKNS